MLRAIGITVIALFTVFIVQGAVAQTATPAVPSIKIVAPATGATVSGARIIVTVSKSNFTFDPAATNNPPVAGRGNYRLFLDGQFAGMDFGAVTALPNDIMPHLKAGRHRLAVQLYNRNNTAYDGAQGDEISITIANDMSYSTATGQPAIEIVGLPQADGRGHFIIAAKISGYKMAPERVNLAPEKGSGHYHVYMDKNKLANVGVTDISSIPSDLNPDPTLLTPGQHTVQLVLETHQHVPIPGGASPVVTFTVSPADLQASDTSLASTPAGMAMPGMDAPTTAAPGVAMTGTATLTASAALPRIPSDGSSPDFGLWLLAIVGVAAIFVLGQATLRGRQPTASGAPPAPSSPPRDEDS